MLIVRKMQLPGSLYEKRLPQVTESDYEEMDIFRAVFTYRFPIEKSVPKDLSGEEIACH